MEKLNLLLEVNKKINTLLPEWKRKESFKSKIEKLENDIKDLTCMIQWNSCIKCKWSWILNWNRCKYCSWTWKVI